MATNQRFRAKARVRLTIEIPVPSVWDETCTAGQIDKQARADVRDLLRKVTSLPGGAEGAPRVPRTELGLLLDLHAAEILKEEVLMVLVEEVR